MLKKRENSIEYFDPDPEYTIPKNNDKDYIIDEEGDNDDDDEN